MEMGERYETYQRRWRKALGISFGVHILCVFLLGYFHFIPLIEKEEPEKVLYMLEAGLDEGAAGGSESAPQGSLDTGAVTGEAGASSVVLSEKQEELVKEPAEVWNKKAIEAKAKEITKAETEPAASTEKSSEAKASSTETDAGTGTQGTAGAGSSSGQGASGTAGATGTGGSGTGTSTGLGAGFSPNGDGTYTASSAAGISYQILRDAEVSYPDEARNLGYQQTVTVTARIMVGLDGRVESVTIQSNPPKLGFREEATRALKKMRFAPIYYQGVNVRVPFVKRVIFQP